jgi:hypothetical protein
MKRTCNGCKAFDSHGYCLLGHPIKTTLEEKTKRGFTLAYTPTVQCEKPLTIDAYLLAKEFRDVRGDERSSL